MGYLNCCENNRTMGVRINGSFQQYITMPISKMLHGKGIDAKTLAMVEPFANARQLIKRVGVNKGERFLIFGAGPIGSLAMVDARRLGAVVYMADISSTRLEYAKKMGADEIINLSEESLDDALQRITGGDGFDVTIEAVGNPKVFMNCIKAVSYRGRMGMIGVTKESFTFNQEIISWKEFTIIGSRNSERDDFELLIDLISGGELQNAKKVITDVYEFGDAVAAFKELETSAAEKMKVMFKF
jgi:threonine dehydrogenase-like Zn-dependent dehydrogenase